jgi:hypothetical protein
MKRTNLAAVLFVPAALICDGAASGQREHVDPMRPAPSLTKVANQIEHTLWYREPDVPLLAPKAKDEPNP